MKLAYVPPLMAIFLTGIATQALADWDHLGSVNIAPRGEAITSYTDFGGRVEALNLNPRYSGLRCREIAAVFGNGNRRVLFSGTLQRGADKTIDLPGDERLIQRLDFECQPTADRQATLDIAADVGSYRDEWRRNLRWDAVWSRIFSWDRGRFAPGWTRVGRESFEGQSDNEASYPGFAGRKVSTVGLRPLNDDARCSRVTATFGNGQTRELNIEGRNLLRRDRIERLDLPGNDRNVSRIDMNCHAVHGRQVTVEVLTNTG